LAVDECITVLHSVPQGSPAFYNTVVQVDGATSGVNVRWTGGAPTVGNPNSTDIYTYTVVKVAAANFAVWASLNSHS